MELRITATELARRLGEVLGKIRFRGDAFIVERNGEPVARLGPIPDRTAAPLCDGVQAWVEAGPGDASFADDLERVDRADRPPTNPWGRLQVDVLSPSIYLTRQSVHRIGE